MQDKVMREHSAQPACLLSVHLLGLALPLLVLLPLLHLLLFILPDGIFQLCSFLLLQLPCGILLLLDLTQLVLQDFAHCCLLALSLLFGFL